MATLNVPAVGGDVTLSGAKPYTVARVGESGGFEIKDSNGVVATSLVDGTPNVVWAKRTIPDAIIAVHNV